MSANRYDLKAEIGFVPQNVAVYTELTVYENVDYFAEFAEGKKEKAACEEALNRIPA